MRNNLWRLRHFAKIVSEKKGEKKLEVQEVLVNLEEFIPTVPSQH